MGSSSLGWGTGWEGGETSCRAPRGIGSDLGATLAAEARLGEEARWPRHNGVKGQYMLQPRLD